MAAALREMPPGRWWIVWIDHVTPSPLRVHVVIAPLPYGPIPRVDLVDAVAQTRRVAVDIGSLPMFAVGDIIDNQRLVKDGGGGAGVASICDEPENGETISFDLDASTLGLRGYVESVSPVRDFTFPSPSGRLFALAELATSRRSAVLTIGSLDGRWFLVPAAETLRSFMAPTSELMAGLFGQTLSNFLQSTLRHLSVSNTDPPVVAFGLSSGLGRRHAPFVANLIRDYNPIGAKAGALIHASLHEPDPDSRPGFGDGTESSIAPGSTALPACFPFGEGEMSIRAKCLRMNDDTFLVCRIVGGSWPPMPGFVFVEEISKRDDDLTPTIRRVLIKSGRRKPSVGGGGEEAGAVSPGPSFEDISLREATSPFGDIQQVSVEPLGWSRLSKMEIKRVDVQRAPVIDVPLEDQDLRGVGFGPATPIGTRNPGTVRRLPVPVPERFHQACRSLDRLVAAGLIHSQENIAEVDVVHGGQNWLWPEIRDGLDVWTFPGSDRRGWTMLPSSGEDPRRPRCLFIRKVVSNHMETFYWISIEGRGEDRYAILLVAFAEEISERDVGEPRQVHPLLGVSEQLISVKGRVSDPDGFFSCLRCGPGRAVVLDHTWAKRDIGGAQKVADMERGGGEDALSAEFDDEAVMEAIESLFAPPGS